MRSRSVVPFAFVAVAALCWSTGQASPRTAPVEVGGRTSAVEVAGHTAPVDVRGEVSPAEARRHTAPVEVGGRTSPAEVAGHTAPVEVRAHASRLEGAARTSPAELAGRTSPEIRVLSSRPDMVSGGDALIEVAGVGTSGSGVRVVVNGWDVTGLFSADEARGTLVGLVDGLRPGNNAVEVHAAGEVVRLTVTNHPITGPILAGPHYSPIVCRTEESGLGEPLDEHCFARTRIDYFYRSTEAGDGGAAGAFRPFPLDGARPADLATTVTTDGREVPYIVRVESGTINRAIYRIAILDDPGEGAVGGAGATAGGVGRGVAATGAVPDRRWRPGPGWNRRLLYSFGGGCGTNYNQGTNQATSALDHAALSRGFAVALSSQNVMGHRCNDALSGETLMMVKEHFIKRYGLPVWTVGRGGSGGAIQQLLIAQNFPGLLDGLLPSLSYADSFTLRANVSDCRLMVNYFEANPSLTHEERTAIEGHTPGTCAAWDRGLANVIVADVGCGIPDELVYNAETNPGGARCTLWDTNVASFGVDPETGFARRSLDNVGVQYGLAALNSGAISKELFLDLNERIGGFDDDGQPRPERTVADPDALRLAYATGRVNSAGGSLGSVPILLHRAYTDDRGDIHDRFRDFTIRERIRRAHGRTDHLAVWIYSGASSAAVSALALETMTEWLDALAADTSDDPAIEKVVRAKPAIVVDACWDGEGNRLDEPASFDGDGRCNQLYPVNSSVRLVAGAPLTDDVLKCQLRPVEPKDYDVEFTADELARLRAIFPDGVCDYSKPGVNQVPLEGTYLRLPRPGVALDADGRA